MKRTNIHYHKRQIFLLLSLLIYLGAGAKHLDPSAALARALSADGMQPKQIASDASSFTLKKTISSKSGVSGCYVFARPESFIIVAADDRAEAVLGYGDDPLGDWTALPPAMEEWLRMYAEEIANAPSDGTEEIPVKARAKVNNLLASKWSQYSPYNDKCPIFSGSTRCVTGCVATAMGQLMFKFKSPSRGTGSHSYTDDIKGNSITLSANFGNTTYDWAHMADTFSPSSPAASKTAISTLMAHLGVATEMDYAMGGVNESGATVPNAGHAFINHFGYSKQIAYLDKTSYSASEWEDVLYGELSAGRSVLYSGGISPSSHAFVCDGYDGAGKYHFNWGWGGQADGYFSLTALKPTTYSSSYDFTAKQVMLIGIKPGGGEFYRGNIIAYNGVKSDISMGRRNGSFSVRADERGDTKYNGFYNYTLGPEKAILDLGANMISQADHSETFLVGSTVTLDRNYGVSTFTVPTESLQPGTYTVRPAVRANGNDGPAFDMQLRDGLPKTFELVVGKTFVKLYNANTTTYTLFGSALQVPSAMTAVENVEVSSVLSSKYGGYSGAVKLQFYDASSLNLVETVTLQDNVDIAKNGDYMLNGSITVPYMNTGDYIVALADADGIPFAESGTVHVEGGAPIFVVKSFNISPDHVHSDDSFTLTGYLGTEAGRYSGTIGCRLRSDASADVMAESADEVTVNITPTLDRYYTFRFDAMPEGQYQAVAFDKTSGEDLVELGTVIVQDIRIDITNVNVTSEPMAHRDFKIDFDITVSEPLWDYLTVRFVDAADGSIEYYDEFNYINLHSLSANVPTAVTFEFRGRDFDVEGGDYYIEFIVGDIWSGCESLPSVYSYGPLEIAEYVCDPLLIGMPSFTESAPAYTLRAGHDYTLQIPVRKIAEGSTGIRAKICSAVDDAEIYSTYLNTSSAPGTEEVLETQWYLYDAGFRGDAYLELEAFDYDYSYAPLSPLEYNRVPVVITDESGINEVMAGETLVRYNPASRTITVVGAHEGEIVTLLDAAGRELIRKVAGSDKFDISLAGFPAGVYIVMTGGKPYKINCR